MRKLSEEFKRERGWYYVGKDIYYWRNCNFCNNEYKGMGKKFCSTSCNRKANPIMMFGKNNPMNNNPEIRIKLSNIMRGRKPSKQTIEASIKSHKGFFGKDARNGRWLEDRTLLQNDNTRRSSIYGNWRKEVYNRDNYKCKINDDCCLGRIEAHHILIWKDFPELRYEINNGITLCHAHHPRKRAEEKRLESIFIELVSVLN